MSSKKGPLLSKKPLTKQHSNMMTIFLTEVYSTSQIVYIIILNTFAYETSMYITTRWKKAD